MIQDIEPHQLNNAYQNRPPQNGDYILSFSGDRVLLDQNSEDIFPRFSDYENAFFELRRDAVYLFTLDDSAFYLKLGQNLPETERFLWTDTEVFRTLTPEWLAFCGVTASHLHRWYRDHTICGRCGQKFEHKTDERALQCRSCGQVIYPTLSPAVIVAVTDGDRLLMTRYANRTYRRYALVAGFAEIGETLEQTVCREVLEEVGLRVKNLRYYKSQPWGFSQSLLVGFFAELDGNDRITLDENELAEAVWVRRGDIEPPQSVISLTAEMIEAFRAGRENPAAVVTYFTPPLYPLAEEVPEDAKPEPAAGALPAYPFLQPKVRLLRLLFSRGRRYHYGHIPKRYNPKPRELEKTARRKASGYTIPRGRYADSARRDSTLRLAKSLRAELRSYAVRRNHP